VGRSCRSVAPVGGLTWARGSNPQASDLSGEQLCYSPLSSCSLCPTGRHRAGRTFLVSPSDRHVPTASFHPARLAARFPSQP